MLAALRLSGGFNALARRLGATPAAAAAAAEALLPRVLAGFRTFDGGVPALIALLNTWGGGALAAGVMSHEAADPAPGLAIMQQIGIGEALAPDLPPDSAAAELQARMLPWLTMLAGGYFAARASASTLSFEDMERLMEPGAASQLPGEEPV